MNRLSSLVLTLRYAFARRVGWLGLVGILLIGLALFVAMVVAPRWKKNAGELRLQGEVALLDLARAKREHRVQPKTGEQLERFNATFPTIDRNAGDLRRLVEQAQLANFDLVKGEYHISDSEGTGFVRYEVVLPVTASYGAVRRFIAGVLNAIPNASLAELHVERAAVSNTSQDTRIHFTFIYRGA